LTGSPLGDIFIKRFVGRLVALLGCHQQLPIDDLHLNLEIALTTHQIRQQTPSTSYLLFLSRYVLCIRDKDLRFLIWYFFRVRSGIVLVGSGSGSGSGSGPS
jgi:hypothetical protein